MEPDNKNKGVNIRKEFDFIVKLLFIVPGGGIIGVVIYSFIDWGPPGMSQYIYPWIFAFGSMILSVAGFMFYHLVKQKEKDNRNGNIL